MKICYVVCVVSQRRSDQGPVEYERGASCGSDMYVCTVLYCTVVYSFVRNVSQIVNLCLT